MSKLTSNWRDPQKDHNIVCNFQNQEDYFIAFNGSQKSTIANLGAKEKLEHVIIHFINIKINLTFATT